jgi:hydroxymethylpyrimidine pyrophosphatase-like HAD family hydrolase
MDYLEISKDNSIAFGDNFNDVEMLKLVGFGVAMGNAPQEVKMVAKHIAPSNLDDGVAQTLHLLFE